MKRGATFSVSLFVLFVVSCAMAADWTQFRGPGGAGSSEETGLVAEWSSKKNIIWKTELPGLGTSGPIVISGRIYLTCYSGYAEDASSPGDMDNLMRHVVCVDRKSGKLLWSKEFEPKLPESKYSGGNDSRHGYASSTPVTDGEHLYIFFGKSGVYCLDLDGNQKWRQDVGDGTRGWGSSNSPVLYKNLLIVNASIEDTALVALDKGTGKQVWKKSGIRGSWNTPVLVETEKGEAELVISLPGKPVGKIVGMNPESGEELWTCEGIRDGGYVVPSVIAHDGIVYAIGGRQNTAVAVRAGGGGDVTESHRLWSKGKGSNVSSPVFHDGHIYWTHESKGIAYCLNAKNGETVYEERLEPRPGLTYSSTFVADGKLYCASQYNGTYVLAAKPIFELLAHNTFEDDNSRINASPIAHDGQLLMRTDANLYCIGTK